MGLRGAEEGEEVLFFDPSGRNIIAKARQYVFTKWNPTATCCIPAHCIDSRRLPLFIARSALRDLIVGLHADAMGVQAA